MWAKIRLVIGIVFVYFLSFGSMTTNSVAAGELISEESPLVMEELDVLKTGETQANALTLEILEQGIKVIPFVGVILFLIGVGVAVFSTRNKGNRRWGIKLAVTQTVISYILYIAMILAYDFAFHDGVVGFVSWPEQMSFYEKVYYDTIIGLENDGQRFLFLEEDWSGSVTIAARRMYESIVGLLVFVSIGVGCLLFVVTKRERAIRRFALAGMCIAIPAALVVGYQFLKM